MRIEIVCSSRELFGSDRSAVRLASLLAGVGHEASLALPQQRPERGLAELARRAGIRAEPRAVVIASRRGLSGLRSRSRSQRSDADLTIYNSLAVVARPGDREPRAVIVREWLLPRWARHRALGAWHRRRVSLAVAVSGGVAAQWRAAAGGRVPVEVCHNWLDDSWFELEPAAQRAGVLFAGRLSSWKGQFVLADAYERAFAQPGPEPGLTFLGAEAASSPFHRNAESLRSRAVAHGWRVLDIVGDPRPRFARAALVVVPSLRPEPFGNVALEALAAGARVIAFPGGGIDDLAPRFPDALTVCERGVEPLAAALSAWWEDGGSAQSEAEHTATLATLREHFSAAAALPRWQRIVERLAS